MQLKFNGKSVMRVGQRLVLQTNPNKPKQKEEQVNNAAKQIINELAKGILARAKEDEHQERQLAQLQPGSPPPVLLAKTETQKRVEDWYEKPGTIKTNVNGVKGMESYTPPPVLLAPIEEGK